MQNDEQPKELAKIEVIRKGGVAGIFGKMTDDSTILGSVCKNVLLPRLVDTAYEASVAALKKVFWGEDTKWSRGGNASSRSGSVIIGSGHTAYNQMSNRNGPEPSRNESPLMNQMSNGFGRKANIYMMRIKKDPANGIVDPWEAATDVVEALVDKFKQADGLLSVQDFYVAGGVKGIPATALDYGWTSIKELKQYYDLDDPDTVIISLPKPIDISKM